MVVFATVSSRQREQYSPQVEAAIALAEARVGHKAPFSRGEVRTELNNALKALVAPIAKGRIAQPKGMNKTEARYAEHLEGLKLAEEILWWMFEGLKLRLADATFYTPDFFTMNSGRELEVREVKGHWEDDARVKIKVAARIFPFAFIAVQWVNGAWREERF